MNTLMLSLPVLVLTLLANTATAATIDPTSNGLEPVVERAEAELLLEMSEVELHLEEFDLDRIVLVNADLEVVEELDVEDSFDHPKLRNASFLMSQGSTEIYLLNE